MADIKWSAFPSGGTASVATTLVGLQAGANVKLSLSATPSASGVGLWDANSNFSSVNFLAGYATTATAAATTTLLVGSKYQQYFTGSTTQTLVLPVTSTLVLGQSFYIVNNSSGVVTVQSSGANTVQAMAASSTLLVTCILTSGTTAASWNIQYSIEADLSGAVLLAPAGIQSISTYGLVTTAITGGNLEMTGNTLSSTNTNGNINIIPNALGIVNIGNSTSYVTNTTNQFPLQLWNSGSPCNIAIATFENSNLKEPAYNVYRSRSTAPGVFVAVQAADYLGDIISMGDDGTQFTQSSSIRFRVGGTVSAGVVPGQIELWTNSASGVKTLGATLTDAQVFTLVNPLLPASGGTGTATAPSAGQIPIGVTGGTYTPAAISSGSGILVANSTGSITISAIGGGIGWTPAPSTPVTAAINTGYIVTDASAVTFTLPVTAAIGSVVRIAGKGAAGWVLAPGSGQTININGSAASTSITSGGATDCIEVVCVVANTTWNTLSYVTKVGFTVV